MPLSSCSTTSPQSEVDDGTINYAVDALFFAAAIKTYAHVFEEAIDEDDDESEWCGEIDFPVASLPLPSISKTDDDFPPQPTDSSSIPSAPFPLAVTTSQAAFHLSHPCIFCSFLWPFAHAAELFE